MDFTHEGDTMGSVGGGNALMGLLAGSALNRDRDDGKTTLLAAIVFVIVFIIAIIAFAMMFRGRDHDRIGSGTDIAAILTPLIAAKSMDCNGKNDYDHDHLEIKSQISHSEDRREISGIKSELGAVALMMQKATADNERDNLKEFGEIKQQLGSLTMGMAQVLQHQNNTAIINGVIQQLAMGKPCYA